MQHTAGVIVGAAMRSCKFESQIPIVVIGFNQLKKYRLIFLPYTTVGTVLLDCPAVSNSDTGFSPANLYSGGSGPPAFEFATWLPPAGHFLAAEQESTQRSRLRGRR